MFNIPLKNNKKLSIVYNKVANDEEIQGYWEASNIIAIDRLHINDHGKIHITIVTNIGLKLLRMLHDYGVKTNIETDHHLDYEDSEVVVFLACILHDIGHIVHREKHSFFSAAIAPIFLERFLGGLYEPKIKARLISDICHAIFTHRNDAEPLTVEAGIVRIADALDMKRGRAKIPFSQIGTTSIHSVSAYAIKDVQIKKGEKKPIRIEIIMANSSGIFQVDSLLRNKLKTSKLADYIEVYAYIEGEVEEKIINFLKI